MGELSRNDYFPEYAIAPGDTLSETLESLGMTQAELAERSGRPKKTINEIIKGRAAITPDTALQFERVLGVPASFWNNLERNYQETLARLREQEQLKAQLSWLKTIPVKAMIKKGWIRACETPVQQLKEMLTFFGVATPALWQDIWYSQRTAFRKSQAFESEPGAVSAWLRKGELEAQKISCQAYDASKFRDVLSEARALTTLSAQQFKDRLVSLCSHCGVAVVFVAELPKTRVFGATRWLTPTKALIQLSFRYQTDDHFWFSFFHEAGHILLHGKREYYLEDEKSVGQDEAEANELAANILIPPEHFRRLTQIAGNYGNQEILVFAQQLGIAPGLVVARLQHEGHVPHHLLNSLKRRLIWE